MVARDAVLRLHGSHLHGTTKTAEIVVVNEEEHVIEGASTCAQAAKSGAMVGCVGDVAVNFHEQETRGARGHGGSVLHAQAFALVTHLVVGELPMAITIGSVDVVRPLLKAMEAAKACEEVVGNEHIRVGHRVREHLDDLYGQELVGGVAREFKVGSASSVRNQDRLHGQFNLVAKRAIHHSDAVHSRVIPALEYHADETAIECAILRIDAMTRHQEGHGKPIGLPQGQIADLVGWHPIHRINLNHGFNQRSCADVLDARLALSCTFQVDTCGELNGENFTARSVVGPSG